MKPSRSRLSLQLCLSMVAAGFALGVCTSAQAQWKWRDANNRVQYSDLPPPGTVPESAILQRPTGARRTVAPDAPAVSASPVVAASSPARTDPELEAKRKKAEQDQAAARKAEEDKHNAAKAENCTRAKGYLKAIEDGQRMARMNANGEREVYDDKIRAEEGKRAREIIASECK